MWREKQTSVTKPEDKIKSWSMRRIRREKFVTANGAFKLLFSLNIQISYKTLNIHVKVLMKNIYDHWNHGGKELK